jgi:hypothetical protein
MPLPKTSPLMSPMLEVHALQRRQHPPQWNGLCRGEDESQHALTVTGRDAHDDGVAAKC